MADKKETTKIIRKKDSTEIVMKNLIQNLEK